MNKSLLRVAALAALANTANAQTIVSAVNVDLSQVGDLLTMSTTDLRQNVHEQDRHAAFNEGNTTLGTALTTNTGTIPAGTDVASFYFHLDPVGSDTRAVSASGSIAFSENVLGIVYSNGYSGSLVLLNPTDATVGVSGVSYNKIRQRGTLENSADRSLTFSGNTVTFSRLYGVSRYTENFRVITAVPVPEPSGSALLGLAGLALLARRKR